MIRMFDRQPRQWRSVNDIDAEVRVRITQRGQGEFRQSVPILVIDDQPLAAATNIRNHGYNIDHVVDITSVSATARYGVVLCDLQGVGPALNSEMQGAHVIREIKRMFPEKQVIAYSGSAKNTLMARMAQEHADKFLKKDAPIQDWVDTLDEAISVAGNPVELWKRFRVRMLNSGMTPFQLAEIEDAFVESFWQGSARVQQSVVKRVGEISINQDLRAVVQGFVSSLLFQLILMPK